jgi:acetyl esterase
MKLGLTHLIDDSAAHVRESRHVNAAAPVPGAAQPPTDPATPEGLHAARSQLSDRPPDPRAVEGVAGAGGHHVPVRVITPRERRPRAAYLQIHGGGFYMDSAARSDTRNAVLADAVGVAVVSVDYRLAPEHPWPAAPDDCETAARWLVDEAGNMFGTTRLMIGGASAGANLAVATLLRLRDTGHLRPFVGAVLQFGAYDLSGRSPSGRAYADEWFIRAYAGHVADRTDPDISPLYGTSTDFRLRYWSSARSTSCWRTAWRWPPASPPPATTSSVASIPSPPRLHLPPDADGRRRPRHRIPLQPAHRRAEREGHHLGPVPCALRGAAAQRRTGFGRLSALFGVSVLPGRRSWWRGWLPPASPAGPRRRRRHPGRP